MAAEGEDRCEEGVAEAAAAAAGEAEEAVNFKTMEEALVSTVLFYPKTSRTQLNLSLLLFLRKHNIQIVSFNSNPL